jgi:hypothetical protein
MTRYLLVALITTLAWAAVGCTLHTSKSEAPSPTSAAPAPARTVELPRGRFTVPFELNSNKIYLNVKVNDTGPWPCVLDMGSNHSLLDIDLARELKLPVTNIEEDTHGAGEVPSEAGQVQVKTLALPGLSYRVGEMVAMPLTRVVGPAEGRALRGTLGFDFLKQVVVEVDYVGRKVTFHDADRFVYPGHGAIVPITVEDGHAFVSAEVETSDQKRITGQFLVDNGARMAIVFNTPVVNEHDLLKTDPRPARATVGRGVGGPLVHHVTRLRALRFGDVTIDQPIATMSQEQAGVFASRDFTGLIGAEVLRRYRLFIDYPHKRLIVENVNAPPEPYEFDMSGLFLAAEGDDYKTVVVETVTENSPAAQVGVQPGDRLESVNEKPIVEYSLDALRQQLKRPGAEVRLVLRRGTETIHKQFVLKRLV